MEKKRFVFDLDGTLLTGNYQLTDDYFLSIYQEEGIPFIQNVGKYLDLYENQFLSYDEALLSKFLSEKAHMNISEDVIDGWIQIVGDQLDDTIEDGVFDTLEYLKKKDKSIVVLTNWFGKTQIPRLERHGLLPYFDTIYTGDGFVKPHRKAYLWARDSYHPKECVFIGDNLEKDYYGPRSYNMESILYDKEDRYSNRLVKIKKMEEIIERY